MLTFAEKFIKNKERVMILSNMIGMCISLLVASGLMCVQAAPSLMADELPSAEPKMIIETPDGDQEETAYSGSAPIVAHFTSNPVNVGNYEVRYEWHVYMAGKADDPYLVRYDRDFDYTFVRSGTSMVSLAITFTLDGDTVQYELAEPLSVTASESVLNIPNAFSPNGDGQNDVFRVKEDYKSIIEFRGYIFSRWGKKLFEWTDPAQGWDGTCGGCDVAEGVYYVRIEAKGADGRRYNIRKAITLLRGYREEAQG